MVRLNADQIRVLAHPLRARLLTALRSAGPATATRLAGMLDTNTGATSYHLRQLAQVGLVVEDPERGGGRQRWWRAAHQLSSWQVTDFDDQPDASAAADWLHRHALRLHAEQAERWAETQRDYPVRWRQAADVSDYLFRLTPDQLRQLTGELHAVLARYRHALVSGDDPSEGEESAAPDDSELVLLYLHAFPVRSPFPRPVSPSAGGADDEETP